MKILITGSQGQLGTTLQDTQPQGIELMTGDIADLDITQKEALLELVKSQQPDVIINAAAYTQVDRAEEEESIAHRVNADGAAHLAEAAKEVGARFIHISTDYVFDGKACAPYQLDTPTDPCSAYGRTKLAGEQAVQAIYPEKSLIIRTAWVYSHVGQNFLLTMLKLMKSDRDQLGVVADQIGTPTSTFSLAQLIWLAIKSDQLNGVYHWTDQGIASWYDFAVAIQEEAITAGLLQQAMPIKPLKTADYPTKAERPAYSVLDKSETVKCFGLEGEHWRKALRSVMQKIT